MRQDIKDLWDKLAKIDLNKFHCYYCDIRFELRNEQEIQFRKEELLNCANRPSVGAFIRVYNNGKWFYTATTELTDIENQLQSLIESSKSISGKNIDQFSHLSPGHHELLRSADQACDQVSVQDKLQLCQGYFSVLKGHPAIVDSSIRYSDRYHVRLFKSSKNISYIYDFNRYGLAASFTIKDGDKMFSDRFMEYGNCLADLEGKQSEVEKLIEESLPFLDAPMIKPGQYKVVLDPEIVGIFAHESFGHKSEADFMLGDEKAKETWKIGDQVASPVLSIVDDGNHYGSSGYCPFDEDGTPASKTYLIKDGILQGRLHSSQTASALDEAPTANSRAMNFEYEPIVRMTSTYVEPGELSFEELIAKVEDGLYIKRPTHGSGLSTFTIAPLKAWWIKNGKITDPVKVSVISGTVFETLKNVEAVADDFKLYSSAFGGCGKGEQWPLPVADGGPSILVSAMTVS